MNPKDFAIEEGYCRACPVKAYRRCDIPECANYEPSEEEKQRSRDCGGEMKSEPAFPVMEYDKSASGDIQPQPAIYLGISKRLYVATEIAAAFVANSLYASRLSLDKKEENGTEVVKCSLMLADALIAAEEKP